MIVVGKDLGVTIGMVERLEQLRHLCRIDLIQQAGYWIEAEELSIPFSFNRYRLTAKKDETQFDLGRSLLSSELVEGVKELYNIMTQHGLLNKYNDWYNDWYIRHVEELWEKLSRVGHPLLNQAKTDLVLLKWPLKWRLELAGVEYLGITILETLNKAMTLLNLSSEVLPTTVEQEQENEVITIKWEEGSSLYIDEEKLGKEGIKLVLDVRGSLNIVEKDGKMILHLNGAPIPNLESCWITPQENGALEVNVAYTIEPKG